MREYALIGHPVEHSKSQEFFNAKFLAEGIDAHYITADLASIKELKAFLSAHPNLHGFNVTSPYKQAILPYLDEVESEASLLGAVNTVVVQNSRWGKRKLIGYNTDLEGFRQSIAPVLEGRRRALILGSGGASCAVQRAFKKLGVATLVVSRTPQSPYAISYSDITPEVIREHKIIVNCTPVGMTPNVQEAPPIPYQEITPEHLCYDLIYSPDRTRFLQLAQAQGASIKNGIDMLFLQAHENWKIWQAARLGKGSI